MVIPLKLVSFNTYLISSRFNQHRVTHPERRAAMVQSFLRRQGGYHLCFLQEVWGSGLPELTLSTEAETPAFDLPPKRTPFLGNFIRGGLAEYLYTVYFHLLQTGGLYDMVKPSSAVCVYRSKHTFTKSRSKSLKGVEATLWTMVAPWNHRYDLLVLNTHLDPWHPTNRRHQVDEIIQFLHSTIEKIRNERPHQTWSKTGVLLVGDFNVKAVDNRGVKTHEYEELFGGRGWNDFFDMIEGPGHSDLAGLGQAQTYSLRNELVAYPEDCGRIDYIFGIDRFGAYEFLPLRCASRSLVQQSRGDEMSDHYPLEIQLLPVER